MHVLLNLFFSVQDTIEGCCFTLTLLVSKLKKLKDCIHHRLLGFEVENTARLHNRLLVFMDDNFMKC